MGSGKKSKKDSWLRSKQATCSSIWHCKASHTLTARNKEDIDVILGAAKNLPVALWRPFFFFVGARDDDLQTITGGAFPGKLVPNKTHPIFALKPIKDTAAFVACPCSSKRPSCKPFRYIKEDTILLHTRYRMDRNSHLVEYFRFNIPPEIAIKLLFKGEVPADALVTVKKGTKNVG